MAINAFNEKFVGTAFEQRVWDLRKEVETANKDYLLQVNDTEYIDYLVNKYKFRTLKLDFDKIAVSYADEMVEGKRFPQGFAAQFHPNQKFPVQVITYHIPYLGDTELLKLSVDENRRIAYW